PRDAWFVANQIADYIHNNPFDLILCGKESIDYNGSQVPAMIAGLLNIPSISICRKLDFEDRKAHIEQEIEGGKEVLSADLPLVIGAAEGIADVKIPNMRGIMGARSKPLETIEPIDVSQLSHIESYETPQPRDAVTLIEPSNLEELITQLHNKSKVI